MAFEVIPISPPEITMDLPAGDITVAHMMGVDPFSVKFTKALDEPLRMEYLGNRQPEQTH